MSDFDEFLNEDLPPPTDIDVKWARENFSSRVLPALNESEEPGSPDFSVVGDPVENQVLEHGLVTTDNTHIATGSVLLASKYGVYRIVVGSTNFSEKQIRNFSSTTPTVDTGEGIIEFLSCTVTQETDSGVMQKCTVAYQYTLKATIKNDTVVPTGLDSVEDGAYFDRTQVKLYDYKFNQASGLIVVKIVDDVPTAVDEAIVWVTEDGESVVSGDVTLNDLAGADTPLVFVQWDPANAAVIAQLSVYGVLVLNNDGTWMYTLDNTRPATQALTEDDHLTFSLQYQIRDNDGDQDTGTMTIGINGSMEKPPLTCVTSLTGSTPIYGDINDRNNPESAGLLWAHIAALTTNLDPDDFHVANIGDSGLRSIPVNRDSVTIRPVSCVLPAFDTLPSEGQGVFMVLRATNDQYRSTEGLFSTPSTTQSATFSLITSPGTPVRAYASVRVIDSATPPPGSGGSGGVPSGAVPLNPDRSFPINFIPPNTEITQMYWVRTGNAEIFFDPSENVQDPVTGDWTDYHHLTFYAEWCYGCYDEFGNTLHYETFAGQVTTVLVNTGRAISAPTQYLWTDNSEVSLRKLYYVTQRGGYSNAAILGYSDIPLPDKMPTVIQWPLSVGNTECFSDFKSLSGKTNLLSEATYNFAGNGGTIGSGYRIFFNNVGSLVSMRFYVNQYYHDPAHPVDIADQKQLFLCQSSNPTTGPSRFAYLSPLQTPSNLKIQIPDAIGVLQKTPTYPNDILLHGAGVNGQKMMRIDSTHFDEGTEVFGGSVIYKFLRVTFQRQF